MKNSLELMDFSKNINNDAFRERQICRRYLMTQCVGMFMEGQKEKTDRFASKFERLPMTDEKV